MFLNTTPVQPGVKPLVIITGPFGAGKTTLIKLAEQMETITRLITHTTRKPREGEQDYADYYFTTRSWLEAGFREGRFVEVSEIQGDLYGLSIHEARNVGRTPRPAAVVLDPSGAVALQRMARQGHPPLAGIDVRVVFLKVKATAARERLVQRYAGDRHGPRRYRARVDAIPVQSSLWREADCVIESAALEQQHHTLRNYLAEIGLSESEVPLAG